MKNCDRMRPQLMAMLDGEIEDIARRECEGHLGECSECAQMLRELQAIRAAPPEFASFDIWPLIQSQIVEDQIDPNLQIQAMLAEMRRMSDEIRTLAAEVAGLRRELKQAGAPVRGTALDLPYVRKTNRSPFQLV